MKKSFTPLVLVILFCSLSGYSQPQPVVVLNKTYGTTGSETSRMIRQTPDGGYLIAGDANIGGNRNIYLIKTDAAGNMLWDKNYGFLQSDRIQWAMDNALQILYNTDGTVNGYLIVGTTTSYAGHGAGGLDVYLIRTDANGNELWSKTFGGTSDDLGRVVRPTSDGGFIIVGLTFSFGVLANDYYLIKTDANGNLQWEATYNLTVFEDGYNVIEVSDGYLVTGSGTNFFKVDYNGDPDPNYGTIPAQPGQGSKYRPATNYNMLYPAGGIFYDIRAIPGGFIGCGRTGSDGFLVRLDSDGNVMAGWPKTITGPGSNFAYVVHPISGPGGPGYIVAGETNGIGSGNWDFWVFRTDLDGNVLWQAVYGGAGNEWCTSMQPASDGGFVLTGLMNSFGAGSDDFWLLKIKEITNPAYIEGKIYRDDVENCLLDPADLSLASQNVSLALGPYIGITNGNGAYRFTVEPGTYSLQLGPSNQFELANCQPSAPLQITIGSGQTSAENNFAVQPLSGPECLSSVSVVSAPFLQGSCTSPLTLSSPCFGFQHKYLVEICNKSAHGTIKMKKSKIQIVLSEGMTYVPGSLIPTCEGDNDIVIGEPQISFQGSQQFLDWDEVNLSGTLNSPDPTMDATKCCVLELIVDVGYSAAVPFIVDADFNAWCDGSGGGNSAPSAITNKIYDACSCDPNDMMVSPKGCGPEGNIEPGQELTYRTRFENIGTGPAHDIVIRDIIHPNLDINSLHIVSSSHAITSLQIEPGNELAIFFQGIELPAGGKGEVFFSLSQLPNLPEGAVITNQADIYFDSNQPVTTNTTLNTVRAIPAPVAAFSFSKECTLASHTYNFNYTGSTPDGATYFWSFGSSASPSFSTAQNPTGIVFNATGPKEVTLTVSRFGCDATISETIEVEDISCGNNGSKVQICHNPGGNPANAHTICVSPNTVAAHLAHGDICGPCATNGQQLVIGGNSNLPSSAGNDGFQVFPNPATNTLHLDLHNYLGQELSISIYNHLGQQVLFLPEQELHDPILTIDFTKRMLPDGIYLLTVRTVEGQRAKQFVVAK